MENEQEWQKNLNTETLKQVCKELAPIKEQQHKQFMKHYFHEILKSMNETVKNNRERRLKESLNNKQ